MNPIHLTPTQKYIWLDQQLHSHSPKYNVGGYAHIHGHVDRQVFEQAINSLIREVEVLRTVVKGLEIPQAFTKPFVSYKVKFLDFTGSGQPRTVVTAWMQEDMVKPYLPDAEYLFDFILLKAGEEEYYWYTKLHHLLTDGWGISLLFKQVADTYAALIRGNAPEYSEQHAYWELLDMYWQYPHSEKYKDDQSFWLKKYTTVPDPLFAGKNTGDLPAVYSADKIVRTKTFVLTAEQYAALGDFAAKNGASVFHIVLSVLYVYLSRCYHQQDMVIAAPVLNRSGARGKKAIGTFMNVIPFRFSFTEDITFLELLQKIKGEVMECYRHQQFPLGDLVNQLRVFKKIATRLFEVRVSYEKHAYGISFGQHHCTIHPLPNQREDIELAVKIREYAAGEEVLFDFDYSVEVFEEEDMEEMLARIQKLLLSVHAWSGSLLHAIDLLTDRDKELLQVCYNSAGTVDPMATVTKMFEEQARTRPDSIAVICEERRLTYRQLDERSDQLAHYLRARGISDGKVVGIYMNRSLELIIGLLAILKAGGAYVPLDPVYPPERVQYMLADSGAQLLITTTSLYGTTLSPDVPVLLLDQEWEIIGNLDAGKNCLYALPGQLCYIIYTSGSTGTPKGVMITHYNLAAMCKSWQRQFGFDTFSPVILSLASISFDAFTADFCRPLTCGGTLVLATDQYRTDMKYLNSLVQQHRVNAMEATPALVMGLVKYMGSVGADLSGMRLLIVGADTCKPEDFRYLQQRFGPQVRILNSYGVTEATIDATFFEGPLKLRHTVPIGKPMDNVRCYILDGHGQPVPVGIEGELCIGGHCVGKGYINNERLTQQKFITDHIADTGNKLYRTGDRACWLRDGNIELIGRMDDQVKIRGYRIEPGEIEAILQQAPGVSQCVVVAKKDTGGNNRLVGYVLPDSSFTRQAAKEFLQKRLPTYMIPAILVEVTAIPLNNNGKIDRKLLPDPDISALQPNPCKPPTTPTEKKLVAIWRELLQVDRIGVQDHFLDLGGDSLSVIRVVSRIKQEFGLEVSVKTLFSLTDIESLSKFIDMNLLIVQDTTGLYDEVSI